MRLLELGNAGHDMLQRRDFKRPPAAHDVHDVFFPAFQALAQQVRARHEAVERGVPEKKLPAVHDLDADVTRLIASESTCRRVRGIGGSARSKL